MNQAREVNFPAERDDGCSNCGRPMLEHAIVPARWQGEDVELLLCRVATYQSGLIEPFAMMPGTGSAAEERERGMTAENNHSSRKPGWCGTLPAPEPEVGKCTDDVKSHRWPENAVRFPYRGNGMSGTIYIWTCLDCGARSQSGRFA